MTRERARGLRKQRRYTVRELAVIGGFALKTVYRALWRGDLPAERNPSGRYWYVPEDQAAAWLLRSPHGVSAAPGYRPPDRRDRPRVRVAKGVWRGVSSGDPPPNAEQLRALIAARKLPS